MQRAPAACLRPPKLAGERESFKRHFRTGIPRRRMSDNACSANYGFFVDGVFSTVIACHLRRVGARPWLGMRAPADHTGLVGRVIRRLQGDCIARDREGTLFVAGTAQAMRVTRPRMHHADNSSRHPMAFSPPRMSGTRRRHVRAMAARLSLCEPQLSRSERVTKEREIQGDG